MQRTTTLLEIGVSWHFLVLLAPPAPQILDTQTHLVVPTAESTRTPQPRQLSSKQKDFVLAAPSKIVIIIIISTNITFTSHEMGDLIKKKRNT